jgi:hypothetical protein
MRRPLQGRERLDISYFEYLDNENIYLYSNRVASSIIIMASQTTAAEEPHKIFDTILTLDFG